MVMQRRKARSVLIIAILAQNASVRADVIGQSAIAPQNIWSNWGLDPGVIIGLFVIALFYFAGLARFWGNGHFGRGVRPREAAAFAGAWVVLLIALVSPLHPLGSALFSAHMIQHELLMLLAAPLLVLGKPIPVLLGALPRSLLRWTLKLRNYPTVRSISERSLNPLIAWAIHAVALWAWHAPALFQASLKSNLVHAVQHASFLGSAEYIRNHGGTGEAWVKGMYHDLLGRNPDQDGLSYWVNQLSHGADPAGVAVGFAASAEREGQHIAQDYHDYLGRSAAADEIARMLSGLRRSLGE